MYDTAAWKTVIVQGGDHIDLMPGGSEVKVISSNVHDYVRKYAEYRMVKAVSKPLEVDVHLWNLHAVHSLMLNVYSNCLSVYSSYF